jgi:two-component system nitrate/nitrite response regulator NarL
MAPPRILIVEDHPLMADALRTHLQSLVPQVQCVQAGNLHDGLVCMAANAYALVLLDLNLPDCEGLDTLNAFCNVPVQWPMAVISAMDEAQVAQICLDNNIVYLRKSVPTAQLVSELFQLLSQALNNPWPGKPGLSVQEQERHPVALLSQKQRLVLANMAQGLSTTAIAQTLTLSETTVRSHMGQIYKRLGVKNRTQASTLYLLWTQQQGWPDD